MKQKRHSFLQKTRRKAYHPFVKAARLIYIPERDHTFPATSPERPFHGFSVVGMNIAAYCASRLREVGFEAVFDPGTPVSEEKGEIIEVSMHDFSPEAAIWLAFCGAGEARSEEGHLLARKSGKNGLTRVFTQEGGGNRAPRLSPVLGSSGMAGKSDGEDGVGGFLRKGRGLSHGNAPGRGRNRHHARSGCRGSRMGG